MADAQRSTADQIVAPDSHAIIITEIEAMGGAERACLGLSRWLHEHGLANHIVTYRDAVGIERFAPHPVTVVQLRPKITARRKVAALRSYFAARPSSPKPLTSGYQPALHATLAGLRGFHCLMHDTPSLFDDANAHATLKQRLSRSMSDRITAHGLRSGGATIVTSAYLQAETRRAFGVEAVIARMGGLPDPSAFHLRPVAGDLRMLSVCRLEANKRIDWMIRALAALESGAEPLSRRIDWQLDIAGKGSQMDLLRALAEQAGLSRRIHFLGFVPDSDLQALYDRAHLFLMPAVQGYGIPAIEALERGIPVLLHRESGVSDILLDTPWATVLDVDETTMLPALTQAIDSVRDGRHLKAPLPPIPTEDTWAEQVAKLCHWI